MAAVSAYVNTDNVGTEDGTTRATGWATLADAIADMNAGTFNSDDVTIECSGATNDTTAVSISISDTPSSITIKGDRPAGDGFNDGAPLIDTAFYLLAPGNVYRIFNMAEATIDTTLDGLQIQSGHSGNFGNAVSPLPQEGTTHTIKNCRILNTNSCDVGIGRDNQGIVYDGVVNIENNIIVGFQDANIWMTNNNNRDLDLSIVHNTIYGNSTAYGIRVVDSASGTVPVTWTVRGNAVANCTTAISLENIRAATTVVQNDNATDDAGRDAADFDIGTLTDAWTSPGTTAAADFTVKNASSNLYQSVNPTLLTADILEFTRDGASHDAGAFELQTAGGSVNLTGALTAAAFAMSSAGSVLASATSAMQSAAATADGAASVQVRATGALESGASTASGAMTVLVAATGALTIAAASIASAATVLVSGAGALVSGAATVVGRNVAAAVGRITRSITRSIRSAIRRDNSERGPTQGD